MLSPSHFNFANKPKGVKPADKNAPKTVAKPTAKAPVK